MALPLWPFTGKWSFHISGSQLVNFPATFCTDLSESLLCKLREAAHLLPPQYLRPRPWSAENHLPAKAEPEWLKLDYWCEKMQQFRWEKLLSMFWKGFDQAAVPTFTINRRAAFGHSPPGFWAAPVCRILLPRVAWLTACDLGVLRYRRNAQFEMRQWTLLETISLVVTKPSFTPDIKWSSSA